jgi:hypothetical protein
VKIHLQQILGLALAGVLWVDIWTRTLGGGTVATYGLDLVSDLSI